MNKLEKLKIKLTDTNLQISHHLKQQTLLVNIENCLTEKQQDFLIDNPKIQDLIWELMVANSEIYYKLIEKEKKQRHKKMDEIFKHSGTLNSVNNHLKNE